MARASVNPPGAAEPTGCRDRPETRDPRLETAQQHSLALVRFFHGLDDPTRVAILELLLDGEKSVGELVERLGRFQGRVSSHLACLRWCGYVQGRREGRNVYYALADQRIRDLLILAHDLAGERAAALSTCPVLGRDRLAATKAQT